MPDLVKLATARELVDAGAVKQVEVIGLPGGWTVQFQTYREARILATKTNEPRRFGTFESAVKVLRDLGVRLDMLRVDATHWEPEGLLGVRRRPDRSQAMKLKELDARFAAELRARANGTQGDGRPPLLAAEASAEMEWQRQQLRVRVENSIAPPFAPDDR